MKNNFINNNGATLQNTKNKKTLVESRIDELKCDNCQANYSADNNQAVEITK